MRLTSAWPTGSTRRLVSCKISTQIPPRPTASTGPNVGSMVMPASSSAPPERIAVTSTPSTRAPETASPAARTFSYPARTSASEFSPSATPPISDLWVICAEQTFSATGSPTRLAMTAASSGDVATPPGTTGTPDDASSCRAAASDQGPETGTAAGGDTERLGGAGRVLLRFSSQRSALLTAVIPVLSPPSMVKPRWLSISRP
jgi:hypothetical protein